MCRGQRGAAGCSVKETAGPHSHGSLYFRQGPASAVPLPA